MIRSPSWTPAFTAAPPVKMKTGVLKCASTNNVFIQVQTTDLVTAFFSTSLAKIKLNLSCVLASHLVGRSALAWLSLHTLWSRNRAGPSARPRISGQDQDLGGWGWKDVKVVFWIFNDRKKNVNQLGMLWLPVVSAWMSAVGSLCWVAEDLRSESPMVRLLSLGLRDGRRETFGVERHQSK